MNLNLNERDQLNKQFITACSSGDLSIIQTLVREYEDYLDIDNGLCFAARDGHLNVVKYLCESEELKEPANVYTWYSEDEHIEDGPLLLAFFDGHKKIVNYLLYDYEMFISSDTRSFMKDRGSWNKLIAEYDDYQQQNLEKRQLNSVLNEELNSADKKRSSQKIKI